MKSDVSMTKADKLQIASIIFTSAGFIAMLFIDWRIDFAIGCIVWGNNLYLEAKYLERQEPNGFTSLMYKGKPIVIDKDIPPGHCVDETGLHPFK